MPAGVSWGRYLRFVAAAGLAMLSGSQAVHVYYSPLRDLHEYVERELSRLPPDVQQKIRNELIRENVLKSS